MKIDLCLLSKQWIIHLNVSNWSGWVFLPFPTYLLSLSYYDIQIGCNGVSFEMILRGLKTNVQIKSIKH